MTVQVAKEEREKFAEMINFWHTRTALEDFETKCRNNHLEKSEVLRALLDMFRLDYEIENRVIETVRRRKA